MPLIVAFERGTGGNFLINCLSLHDNATFSSMVLAEQQMSGEFTVDEKLDYLLTELNKTKNSKWNDLGLGNGQLNYRDTNFVKKLYKHNLNFCLIAHNDSALKEFVELFPDSEILSINNSRKFLEKYRPARLLEYSKLTELQEYYKTIKKPHWPKLPPRYLESLNASPFKELNINDSRLKELLFSEVYLEEHYTKLEWATLVNNSNYIWDAVWFFEETVFLKKIQELYEKMNYRDIHLEKIKIYYNNWIKTMSTNVT